MRIRVLKERINKNGYEYRLVKRDEKRCLYAQQDGKKVIAYEVFKIRLKKPHPRSIEDCQQYDRVENFPGDEEFGRRAWTYKNLEEALKRYETLCQVEERAA